MEPWLLVVILGAFTIVYALMRTKNEADKQTGLLNDIETTLDQFAAELEEDNRQLIDTIANLKRDLEADLNKLSGRIEALEKQKGSVLISQELETEIEKESSRHFDKKAGKANPSSYSIVNTEPSAVNQQESANPKPVDSSIRTDLEKNHIKNRYGSLFEMHSQGKSIEYIAKKNGMNKGEVQLIIQLARQEEQFRVEG